MNLFFQKVKSLFMKVTCVKILCCTLTDETKIEKRSKHLFLIKKNLKQRSKRNSNFEKFLQLKCQFKKGIRKFLEKKLNLRKEVGKNQQ